MPLLSQEGCLYAVSPGWLSHCDPLALHCSLMLASHQQNPEGRYVLANFKNAVNKDFYRHLETVWEGEGGMI